MGPHQEPTVGQRLILKGMDCAGVEKLDVDGYMKSVRCAPYFVLRREQRISGTEIQVIPARQHRDRHTLEESRPL